MFSVLLYYTISAFYLAIMAMISVLDDADLDIVDYELDIDQGEGQQDRRQQQLPTSVRMMIKITLQNCNCLNSVKRKQSNDEINPIFQRSYQFNRRAK